jgi:hypothetical protein
MTERRYPTEGGVYRERADGQLERVAEPAMAPPAKTEAAPAAAEEAPWERD